MNWKTSHDGIGNEIKPGDICVRSFKSNKCEYCIFISKVWGGKKSSGEYGRFMTSSGKKSIKYRNVLLAFDPMSDRRATVGVKELTRSFYEQGQ